MKTHLFNNKKYLSIFIVFFIISIPTNSFTNWSNQINSNAITLNIDENSTYPRVIKKTLSSFSLEQSENEPYYILNAGGITEAFDTQAVGAVKAKIAKYWYPHYLTTVIIAIDRDQTDALVTSWKDLISTQEEVGFFYTPGNLQMLTAAISYGLEGEELSLEETIQLLSYLNEENRLKINSFDTPIIICFDHQATKFIENGRNIEIIIPSEGTYTYEKGLLSNEKLNFQGDVDKLLIEANLRPLDGQNNSSLYPEQEDYKPAVRVKDYNKFSEFTQNIEPKMERYVFKSQLYMSIGNDEHLFFALMFIIVTIIWINFLLYRSIQKGVSYASFFTGIILISWILVRLIKYQIDTIPTLTRYLWYSFYIFQLSLPLVLLWMAWAIDKVKDRILPPKWWRIIAIIVGLLIVMVFTNDLHGLVLKLDLSRSDWGINYGYGFGYYIIVFISMANLITVFAILVGKSIKNTRSKRCVFPILVFILFVIYNYKYISRDPLMYQTDLTIITGIFTMLTFEAYIWSGLIPVNNKYIDIFKKSPLRMQIVDKDGLVKIEAESAISLDQNTLNKVLDSLANPIWDKELLIFANPIPGGYAVWQEDVSSIYELNREIEKSTQMLIKANDILAEEEKIKRLASDKNLKKKLMGKLEDEVAVSLKELENRIEKLSGSKNDPKETTSIALLLCYIKRRCNFFFYEKEKDTMNIEELVIYIEEFSEIIGYQNLRIVTLNQIEGEISIRYATLFYEFAYLMADLAVNKSLTHSIQDLEIKDSSFGMGFLASKDFEEFKIKSSFINNIESLGGKIVIKDLEDTLSVRASLPKGGREG